MGGHLHCVSRGDGIYNGCGEPVHIPACRIGPYVFVPWLWFSPLSDWMRTSIGSSVLCENRSKSRSAVASAKAMAASSQFVIVVGKFSEVIKRWDKSATLEFIYIGVEQSTYVLCTLHFTVTFAQRYIFALLYFPLRPIRQCPVTHAMFVLQDATPRTFGSFVI